VPLVQDRTSDCVAPRIRRKWTLIRATTNHTLGRKVPAVFFPDLGLSLLSFHRAQTPSGKGCGSLAFGQFSLATVDRNPRA